MSRALVVSGGGSKGAYAVGVAKVLMEEAGIGFDVVAGTSTGGLVAPFVATGRLDAAEDFYTTVRTEDILEYRNTSQLLKAPSLASFSPLVKKVREAVGEIGLQNLLQSATRMFVAATRLQDRNAVFFHTGPMPDVEEVFFSRLLDEDDVVRAMVATASVPGIAPPVQIGDFQYVDGGVREMTPLAVPVALGVQEIYVILLSPQESPLLDKNYASLPTILGRTADALTTDVSRHDLDPIKRAEDLAELFEGTVGAVAAATPDLTEAQVRAIMEAAHPGLASLAATRFVVVAPEEELTENVMDFNPTAMKRMLEQGVVDARAVIGGT